MTFVNDIRTNNGGLFDRFATALNIWRTNRADRATKDRVYGETLRQLGSLSDRDLADIGMHRASIKGIAHEAAYGA